MTTQADHSCIDDYMKYASIPIQNIRLDGKNELISILQSLRGRKCLILDNQLGSLFNNIISFDDTVSGNGSKFLRENGVIDVKKLNDILINLNSGNENHTNADHIIYITRANLINMRIIAGNVKDYVRSMETGPGAGGGSLSGISTKTTVQHHIYYIPFHTIICEQILEDEQVLEHISTIGEYSLGLVPLDSDILSLEMPDMFKQCYVDGDTSALNAVAQSLHKLQTTFGLINNIKAKGAASKKVIQKLLHLRREVTQNHVNNSNIANNSADDTANKTNLSQGNNAVYPPIHHIDTVVVLDREVDLVSALTTPLTYEGLIDELIGIDFSKITVDAKMIGDIAEPPKLPNFANMSLDSAVAPAPPPAPAPKPVYKPGDKLSLTLTNSDPIFHDIRNISIERLGAYMQQKAISIRQTYNAFRENKDASLQEIADFVKKIPTITREYRLLHQHINIAEQLKHTTDSRDFRDYWQLERGIVDGELSGSSSGSQVSLDAIEDMIHADVDRVEFFHILRLLCLQSICSGGIRKNYDQLKRLIIQTYGYEHVFTLLNLEKAGFLKRKGDSGSSVLGMGGFGNLGLGGVSLLDNSSSTAPWQMLKTHLNLLNDEDGDISYVASGYAPLSVRLVQAAAYNCWHSSMSNGIKSKKFNFNMDGVMRLLPGPLIEFSQYPDVVDFDLSAALNRQQRHDEHVQLLNSTNNKVTASSDSNNNVHTFEKSNPVKKILMVYMIGGLTYLEISALRKLSNDPMFPYTIVMATTKVVNATTLLASLLDTSIRY